jgi:hypothetical protein
MLKSDWPDALAIPGSAKGALSILLIGSAGGRWRRGGGAQCKLHRSSQLSLMTQCGAGVPGARPFA